MTQCGLSHPAVTNNFFVMSLSGDGADCSFFFLLIPRHLTSFATPLIAKKLPPVVVNGYVA